MFHTDLVIDGGLHTLKPGTYCGGLTIRGGASVTLDPGVFAILDGPFRLEDGAAIEGEGVGLYFEGQNARLDFDNNSSVSLTAPVSGDMAGLLMFESRSQPEGNTFDLLSNHAPNLLGTIYIPKGELRVDSEATLANESAYTAIVANTMRLYGGPHLILNTNYDKTDVPVPKGIRGAGQPVALVR